MVSRHSDKHTRPYRCTYPTCEDLAGFGWVGGLNRHLEELHNSKAQHKCPYTDCKRHVNGFSRSANLKNHMWKVHNVGSEGGGGGPTALSETADNSADEIYSPPTRERKRLRQTDRTEEERKRFRRTDRTEEELLSAIGEAERAVAKANEGMRGARQTQLGCLVHLETLKAELEDGRSNSSASISDSFHYSSYYGDGGYIDIRSSPCLPW